MSEGKMEFERIRARLFEAAEDGEEALRQAVEAASREDLETLCAGYHYDAGHLTDRKLRRFLAGMIYRVHCNTKSIPRAEDAPERPAHEPSREELLAMGALITRAVAQARGV